MRFFSATCEDMLCLSVATLWQHGMEREPLRGGTLETVEQQMLGSDAVEVIHSTLGRRW